LYGATAGKREGARRSAGSRVKNLSELKKVADALMDPLLCVVFELRTGKVPALVDTGSKYLFFCS